MLWLAMKITTYQPKWHMTFDGHLLHQVITYGGLANKSDESIELQHQTRSRLRDRFRSAPSYKRREECIRQAMRRSKSPEIQNHLDEYDAKKRRNPTSQRQLDFTERKEEQREAKRVKREAFIDG